MDVQIQSSAEPLDDGHGSRTTVVDPVSPRAVAVEAEERTHVHAEHRACPHVIPRQAISKPVREAAQHSLPHWQNYKFMNPATKKVEPKQMYCERLNETMVCGRVYTF